MNNNSKEENNLDCSLWNSFEMFTFQNQNKKDSNALRNIDMEQIFERNGNPTSMEELLPESKVVV